MKKTRKMLAVLLAMIMTPGLLSVSPLTAYAAPGDPDSPTFVNPFTDVSENAWYFGDVQYVCEKGLMNGTAVDKFSPNMTLTREMLVTALWRLRGSPMLADFQNPFSDVDWRESYFDAVLWATASKIVSGYGDGKFRPDDPITRQDFVVILMRYMNDREINIPVTLQYILFADEVNISGYAKDAIQTFNKLGIINGIGTNEAGQTIINPKGNTTRAEAAAMLHGFMELINSGDFENKL